MWREELASLLDEVGAGGCDRGSLEKEETRAVKVNWGQLLKGFECQAAFRGDRESWKNFE